MVMTSPESGFHIFIKKLFFLASSSSGETFSPFFAMRELQGKTIGVIGYGSIGRKVADVARVFGMKVMAYSRSQEKKDPNFRILEYASIDDILANSDIVTMHCPLNEDSKYMCNKEFFKKMKKDALFINTSRGNVVDEEALAWAHDLLKLFQKICKNGLQEPL